MYDDRNYDVTNKIFSILNEVKGFDVGFSNPRMGKIIVRYKDTDFYMDIKPIYPDLGKPNEKSFEEVMRENHHIFENIFRKED